MFLKVRAAQFLDALGARIDKRGSTQSAISHRLLKANGHFWNDWAYRSKFLSVRERFERYQTRLIPIMLYSCESWAFSMSVLRILCGIETFSFD